MQDWRKNLNGVQLFFQLSAILLTAILGSLLLGIFLDRSLGIAPLGTLCLTSSGILLGTATIYRVVNRAYKSIGGRKQ